MLGQIRGAGPAVPQGPDLGDPRRVPQDGAEECCFTPASTQHRTCTRPRPPPPEPPRFFGSPGPSCSKRQCICLSHNCKLQGKNVITSLLKLWVITPGLSVIITDKALLMQLSGTMFTQQTLPCLGG